MNKNTLFGFWFHHGGKSTYVIDGGQLASVSIPFRDRVLTTDELNSMMLVAATKYDAVYFDDADTTVEPVVNGRSAPRFIILESLKDHHLFARMFDPRQGYSACNDSSGAVVNSITAFADNSLELNTLLYADANHGFPHSTIRKALKTKGAVC